MLLDVMPDTPVVEGFMLDFETGKFSVAINIIIIIHIIFSNIIIQLTPEKENL